MCVDILSWSCSWSLSRSQSQSHSQSLAHSQPCFHVYLFAKLVLTLVIQPDIRRWHFRRPPFAAALVAVAARRHYYNVPAQPSDSLQEQPPRPPSPPTSAAAPPGQQWLLPLMDCHDRRHSEKMICRHIICLYIAALSRCNNLVIWSLIDLFNT